MSKQTNSTTKPAATASSKPAGQPAAGQTGASRDKIVATRIGLVESDKRDKTRKVVVPNLSTHAKYGKIIRRRTVLHVHDEQNQSRLGDRVEVRPCNPVSKTKRWELVRIVEKGAAMRFEGVEAPTTKA